MHDFPTNQARKALIAQISLNDRYNPSPIHNITTNSFHIRLILVLNFLIPRIFTNFNPLSKYE